MPDILDMQVERVAIDAVQPFPGNARIGHRPTLQASLDANGQYKPIVVQQSTSYVLAGNNLWFAAKDAGQTEINVLWIDVDDERARAINLMDNRASDKASYDDRLLAELLDAHLEDTGDLVGTGYDFADLDQLATNLDDDPDTTGGTDPADEWDGMPEFSSDNQMPEQSIKVHFRNTDDRDAFAELVGQRISDDTNSIWYPAAIKDQVADKAIVHQTGMHIGA